MADNNEKFLNNLLSFFKNSKTNCLLILDKKGKVVGFNHAFTENFGYSKEDLAGKNFETFFNETDRLNKKPEEEIQSVLKTGYASDNNYLVAKNGSQIWISGESILVQQNSGEEFILKVVQNIQTHKITELNYIELNEFNESILATIDDAVIVLDSQKKMFRYNLAFESIIHSVEKPITYKKLIQFLGSFEPKGELEEKIKKTIRSSHGFKNLQITIPDPVNEQNVYVVNGYKLALTNQKDRTLIMFNDITHLKKMENEREDIMAFVAHELRSPLASLTLSYDLVDEYLDEEQTEKARLILGNVKKMVQRINKMVAELNSSSQIHGGNMQLEKTRFSFTEMIEEVCMTLKALNPAFVFTYNEKDNIDIVADKFRLIEVITNYLSNAIKYSSGTKKITIHSGIKNNKLVFSVTDHGRGISKEELPFTFNRYFRSEKTKNFEGIGLGLYLCEKIIQAHGGKVWVESVLGKGSEFYFSIPADSQAE